MINWNVLRAAGIGSYLMLFLSVAWGLVASSSIVTKRISKPASIAFHQFVATVGLLLLGVHIGGVLIDEYVPFEVSDVLVPLGSTYRPIAIAFGIVAMYMTVIVVVTSWARRFLGTRWWRRAHLLAAPAFVIAMIHGIFAGSDTTRPWMWQMYGATGVVILFLILVRGLSAGYRPPRPSHSSAGAAHAQRT